jgi:hypothetical protein
MENIQQIEKLLGTFMARIKVKKLTEGIYCEIETPNGRLYYTTDIDENGQSYYAYGRWKNNVWDRPSIDLIHKYFRIDLVDCLVVEQQGRYPNADIIMAIPRKDLQKKILPDTVWS